jgi:hypothetical protein
MALQMDCENPKGKFHDMWVAEFDKCDHAGNDSGLLKVSIFPVQDKNRGCTWHNVFAIEFVHVNGLIYGMRLCSTSGVENKNGYLYQQDGKPRDRLIQFFRRESGLARIPGIKNLTGLVIGTTVTA